MQSFLEILNDRERKILDMRFGLTDGDTHTLAEIAKELGVSRERVRQLEVATIKKILPASFIIFSFFIFYYLLS